MIPAVCFRIATLVGRPEGGTVDESLPQPFLSPRASWEAVLRRYGAYPDDGWFTCIKPFSQLVARIADSPWADRLYASTSHQWLVVAQVAGWPERVERPHLVVGPLPGAVEIEHRGAPSLPSGGSPPPLAEVGRLVVRIEDAWDPPVDRLEWLIAER